jgi:hypothetical protein
LTIIEFFKPEFRSTAPRNIAEYDRNGRCYE